MDNTQNVISFCTGYGGIELGLRRAGVDVRVVCNVEIEAFVQANLVAKIEEGRMDNAPIYSDLKTFPASIFRGKICGLIGGYPCQPFSSAGKRKGEDDPRHLWPYIRKHIRAIRPLWCFFENVRGHTTMGLWRVLSDLEEEGYETEWGLFSAEETGAPHQRIRCFILAKLPHARSPHDEVHFTGGYSTIEGCIRQSLGNPKHDGLLATQDGRSTCEEQEEGRMQELEGGCKQSQDELANGKHKRFGRRPASGSSGVDGEGSKTTEEGQEGDGLRGETEGCCGESRELANPASREPRQSQARNGGQDTGGGSEDTRWPARPGEEQYEWEEPRVTEAQCELGGAVDGTQHRVDRLRLLGNGVVPQTAELAWKTLWKKMN